MKIFRSFIYSNIFRQPKYICKSVNQIQVYSSLSKPKVKASTKNICSLFLDSFLHVEYFD